jgi:hypothetical protein
MAAPNSASLFSKCLIDAELGYLRSLGDLVQCRRLKTQFHKEFARGVDYRLAKRLIGGPAAPARMAVFRSR